MKKLLAVALLSSLSFTALAENQPKHIISIGTDGLGWSALGTKYDWNKGKSGVKDQDSSNGSLALNYHYVFPSRVMLGAELFYEMDKTETKFTDDHKETEENSVSSFAISLGYNFNEDLNNSWWIKASLGAGTIESENKDTSATPQKTKREYDVSFFTIEGGKRFSFDSWGLKNFSYSPSIAITSASYGEDADDVGLDKSTHVQLNILKFDILF